MEEQEKLMKPKKLPSGLHGRVVGFNIIWDKAKLGHIAVVVIDSIRGHGPEKIQGERFLEYNKDFAEVGLLRSNDRIRFSAHVPKNKPRLTHVGNVRKDIIPQTKLDDFSDGDKEHD